MRTLYFAIVFVLCVLIGSMRPALMECKTKLIYEFLDIDGKVMAKDSADQVLLTNHGANSYRVGKKILTPENIRITIK